MQNNPVIEIVRPITSLIGLAVANNGKYMRVDRTCVTFYRPQRSWGKVMFLHVSVILFTGGGGIPACIAGGIPACLAAGLGGGIPACLAGRFPGPQPGGKLRGLAGGGWGGGVSRPTPSGRWVYPSMH